MNSFRSLCLSALAVLASSENTRLHAATPISFERDIQIILEAACVNCHGDQKQEGDLRLDTRDLALKGGENGTALVPGKPEDSPLYSLTILPHDDDNIMPPKADFLTPEQTDLLQQWILEGASWPDQPALQPVPRINFAKNIQPILETSCVSCHRPGHADGELRLDTREQALKGGDNGPALVPGKPNESPLHGLTILETDDDDLMPPSNKGGPLPKEETDLLRNWILQGAYWPPDLELVPRKKEIAMSGEDEKQLVAAIHQFIQETSKITKPDAMTAYTNTIPGSAVKYALLPIRGGTFVMGSPDNEPDRQEDEGPQHRVKIAPFWMGQFEVTWNEFELFMYPTEERKMREFLGYQADTNSFVDAISRPTAPYVEMSFGMGKDGYPAISMTHHAASKYCQWLSAKTGHFYRLPTEAEWEYACRAGTTTAFSFGDDPAALADHAWYAKNSNWKYQKVGTKQPNPWGLHDMHGNVAEWVLDQYDPEYYKNFVATMANDPWNKASTPYPQVARGGSWDDDPQGLRSAARRASDPSWKSQDPQLPKSIWYLTDAQFLGFRVVRPLEIPPPDALFHYWNSGVEVE